MDPTSPATPPEFEPTAGSVTFVGSGPGDLGLLTMNGSRALQVADLVIVDEDADEEAYGAPAEEVKPAGSTVGETVGGAVSARIGSPTLCGFTYVGVCDARTYVQAGIDYSETAIDVHLPFVPSRGADDSSGARVLHATRRSDNR